MVTFLQPNDDRACGRERSGNKMLKTNMFLISCRYLKKGMIIKKKGRIGTIKSNTSLTEWTFFPLRVESFETRVRGETIVIYRVFIKYCFFSKDFRIFLTLSFSVFPRCQCVYRQVEHQRCSRTGRVQKITTF